MELARRQLLANLVHELGRPLGALRSAIHALSKGAADDPQLLYDLTTGMDEETARLQHVLEDLAHLHDQVLGTLEMNLKPIDLSEWLPRMLLPWQEAALEKKLEWRAEIPADLPTVQADPVRLAQIVGNLASNAVKYTPPGQVGERDSRRGGGLGVGAGERYAVRASRPRSWSTSSSRSTAATRAGASSRAWGWG